MPTFNRASQIEKSIESVLNQTHQELELIIVDDGSSDNTEEVVRSFKDSRVSFFKFEKNQGQSAARNFGIKQAKYDLVAFQDSDDEWMPNKLGKQFDLLSQSDSKCGMVFSGYWRIKEKIDSKKYLPDKLAWGDDSKIVDKIFDGNFISVVTVLCKKEILDKVGGFDEKMRGFEDWDLFIRMANSCQIKFIDEPLVIVHAKSSLSVTENLKSLTESTEMLLEKNRLNFKKRPAAYGKRLAILADFYGRSGNYLKAKQTYNEAVKYNHKLRYVLPKMLLDLFGISLYQRVMGKVISMTQ